MLEVMQSATPSSCCDLYLSVLIGNISEMLISTCVCCITHSSSRRKWDHICFLSVRLQLTQGGMAPPGGPGSVRSYTVV